MKNSRLFDESRDRSQSTTLGSGRLQEAYLASPPHIDDISLSGRLWDTSLAPSPHIDDISGSGYSTPGPSNAPSTPSPSTAGAELRPKTLDIGQLPLPPDSMKSKSIAMKNHPPALKKLEDMKLMIQARKDAAITEKNRQVERGVKPGRNRLGGRGASKPESNQAPKGFRAILQWADNLPIRQWSTKFNNYIDVLVRKANIINPYLKFRELPWRSYEDIWRELMENYCLEDHPGAWHYVFNVKVEAVLKQWRHELKASTYDKYTTDWQRFLNVDDRVNLDHFTALLFYWDTKAAQNKSKKRSANRNSKRKLDRHLGSTSLANLEYGYCRSTGKPIMPVNLQAKLACGIFRSTYEDEDKTRENLLAVDGFDVVSRKAALRATQDEADDPHILSRKENDIIAGNVMGHNNMGSFPLMGVVVVQGMDAISSTASSPASTLPGSPARIPVTSVFLRIACYLRGKIDPTLLVQVTKALFSDLPKAPTMDKVMPHIILCLSDTIPADLFGEVLSLLEIEIGNTGSGQTGAQARDAGGE